MTPEKKIITLEMATADLERTMDELNAEVVRLAQVVEKLEKEHGYFKTALAEFPLKAQEDEINPPHY